MNKKIVALLVIFLLLATNIAAADWKSDYPPSTLKEKVSGFWGKFWKSGSALSSDTRHIAISVFFLMASFSMLQQATADLSSNITTYILQNPPVYSDGFRSMIGFFISLIQPFYILAIILTAFYIMFVSDSYTRRSRAKSMMGKLVVGLIITSFSLPILWTFFSLSESVTESILNQGMVERAIDEYNHALWQSYLMMFYTVVRGHSKMVSKFFEKLFSETAWSKPGRSGGSVAYTREWVKTWQNFFKVVKVKGKVGRSIPFLMSFTMLLAGLYILISIRYLMAMIWALLFPLMIFFLSFDMTRRTGRTMMEQTILWTILQVFYAVIFTITGAALTIVPPRMYGSYVFAYHGVGEALLGNMMELSVFTIAAAMALYLGPVVLFNLFQRLFPP